MPTYEYLCPKGHRFDLFQRITAEPGANCPECGERAERQLSPGAGLLFKGSGFYITDYRSDSYKKSASAEKPAASDAKSEDARSGTGTSGGGSSEGSTGGPSTGGSSSGGSGASSSKNGE